MAMMKKVKNVTPLLQGVDSTLNYTNKLQKPETQVKLHIAHGNEDFNNRFKVYYSERQRDKGVPLKTSPIRYILEKFGPICTSDRPHSISGVSERYIADLFKNHEEYKFFIVYDGVKIINEKTNEVETVLKSIKTDDFAKFFNNHVLGVLIYKQGGCKGKIKVDNDKTLQLSVICQNNKVLHERYKSQSLIHKMLMMFMRAAKKSGYSRVILEAANNHFNEYTRSHRYGHGSSIHLLCLYHVYGFVEDPALTNKEDCFEQEYKFNTMSSDLSNINLSGYADEVDENFGKLCMAYRHMKTRFEKYVKDNKLVLPKTSCEYDKIKATLRKLKNKEINKLITTLVIIEGSNAHKKKLKALLDYYNEYVIQCKDCGKPKI